MIFNRLGRYWVASSLSIAFALLVPMVAQAVTIDAMLAQAHAAAAVTPTGVCDDATFLRRLSLDLIGRVPTEEELAKFLDHPDRQSAVDRLLAENEHPQFWSQLWTSMLVGRGQQRYVERELLRDWLQQSLADRQPIHQMVFQLITAEGVTSLDGPVNYVAASRGDPVMRLSRAFLSVQLDCAQCHDHPHDRWTNDDYQSMQRFFSLTQFREVSGGIAVAENAPGDRANLPVFLTGRKPRTSAWRRELGMMVVTSKPFSRAMVNRTWYWLMGRGIVDPVDALSRENPAVMPELLETLAADLRAEQFGLRSLIRRICLSEAYQRAAEHDQSTESERRRELFAARTARPLLPEQWIASVAIVLDRPAPTPEELARQCRQWLGIGRQVTPASDPFAWTPTTQTLIRQLSGEIPVPLRDVDSLFLATLARKPTDQERKIVSDHTARETVFALVHGNEFMTND